MYTDDFVALVRSVTQVPDDDEDITSDFILEQGYLALLERFTHPITLLRNGTWLHHYTFTTTPNVAQYRIPDRSIVQGLEKIECAMQQSPSTVDSSQWYLLNVQTNIQATDYEGLNYVGRPAAFTYLADTLQIFPTPKIEWTIRVYYYLRPSSLALYATAYAGQFREINAIVPVSGDTYTLEADSDWVDGDYNLDLQFQTGNCEMVAVDVPSVNLPAPTVFRTVTLTPTAANLITRELSAGKSLNAYASGGPVVQIQLPDELCNALVSYVAAVVLALKGDSDKAQVFAQKAEVAIKNIVDLAIPRAKGQPSVFKTRNSYLRRRIGRWGWGGGWGTGY